MPSTVLGAGAMGLMGRAVALTDRDASGRVTSFRLDSDTRPLFEGIAR